MIKKFLKQLDVDAHVIRPDRSTFRLRNDLYCVEWGVKLYSLIHPLWFTKSDISNELKHPKVSLFEVVFHPHCVLSFFFFFTCTHKAQTTKLVHASTTASSSSAMLKSTARHTRLDSLDKVERVESRWAKWNLAICSYRLNTGPTDGLSSWWPKNQ